MKWQAVFLGTGTSTGVPVIGCDCAVCQSKDGRDRRTRSSLLLRGPRGQVLIDSGPDLREQALRLGLKSVEAVFYTHAHLDHFVGFDELRAFCWAREERLPLYGLESTLEELRRIFPWAFAEGEGKRGYVRAVGRVLEGRVEVAGFGVEGLRVEHGNMPTCGYLIEGPGGQRMGYFPDLKKMGEAVEERLMGVEVLAVDCLRPEEHATHQTLGEALRLGEKLGVKRLILTHLAHQLGHGELEARVPQGVEVAYDGLVIEPGWGETGA